MINSEPIHERTIIAELLALTSGSIDGYSYLTHGNVFAGLQTGNLILLGINIAKGHWSLILNYLIPIFVFVIGATITKLASLKISHYHNISRQEFILGVDSVLLILVGIIGNKIPLLLTSLMMSLVISILFTEFNKIHGTPLTVIMMTGNFKNTGTLLLEGILKHDNKLIMRSFEVFKIILSFFIGVIINAILVKYFSFQAIFFSAIILAIILFTITYNNHKITSSLSGEMYDKTIISKKEFNKRP
ncbi:YoaK family protein [Companilactobacillus sp. DQM5]|uniref:YoaK family protein n=1 Tax=Companilactobacillus sp. DQM5 TaxID=3463359 RepID=UPI00405838CE